MTTFRESKSYECRWSWLVERLIGDWEVLWEEAEVDYQGSAELLVQKDGRFCYIGWSYGSCSGCDCYEDLDAETAYREITKDAMFFDDVVAARRWIAMLAKTKDPKAEALTLALGARPV